jgi:DNA-binding CsgD family transcriptional regulator
MGSRTSNDGLCGALDIINVSYPSEWLESYFSRRYCMVDPVIKENFTKFSIQFLADTYKNAPKDFIMLAEDFGLTEGYTHGMRDGRGIRGSLFSFAGSSVERHLRNEVILGYIIPHLHLALARILARPGNKNRSPLSMREKEVVRWLKAGKSAWDISLILGISERTVRFHINNIMQKLDAVNRTHAVAIALEQGLIDFE